MPRIFIAKYLDDNISELINNVIMNNRHLSENWGCKFDFTPLEKLHITFLFMGEVTNPELVESTIEAMVESNREDFYKIRNQLKLTLDKIELWPNKFEPKTLVIRASSFNEHIAKLHQKIKLCLTPFLDRKHRDKILGQNSFKPHITLGRFNELPPKNSTKKIALNDIRFLRTLEPLEQAINSISIVESSLKQRTYTQKALISLID